MDAKHTVSSAFQFVNVPMGVWIDEQGRVVRPAEPAWTSTRTDTFGGKPLAIEGEIYVAALATGSRTATRAKWMENFQKQQEPYYPKLDIKPKAEKPE